MLMELTDCLNRMWAMFVRVSRVDQKDEIEEFVEAKDKAHELISKIARRSQWSQ